VKDVLKLAEKSPRKYEQHASKSMTSGSITILKSQS